MVRATINIYNQIVFGKELLIKLCEGCLLENMLEFLNEF